MHSYIAKGAVCQRKSREPAPHPACAPLSSPPTSGAPRRRPCSRACLPRSCWQACSVRWAWLREIRRGAIGRFRVHEGKGGMRGEEGQTSNPLPPASYSGHHVATHRPARLWRPLRDNEEGWGEENGVNREGRPSASAWYAYRGGGERHGEGGRARLL